MSKKPNIVLVHGAWGDGSHWRHVIPRLHADGYAVRAVQNPLTSLADDIDRTSKLVAALDGPTLLVGHSYGGMVITEAGHLPNVVGLVYVAAFAPDEGENPGGIFGMREAPPGAAIIRPDDNGFLWLDPEQFHENFCQDVDETEALVMSLSQNPIAARCFEDKSGVPAWKEKPSWYQISANDRMIPPETERWFAERMKPQKTVTLEAGHASMASHADDIIALVEEAAAAVQ
ncbi:alpha/beta hydrolase [Microbulbifer taiwanensis]|uniref:Alpha/beta hydrolase n=1 Tax=Microbulbifer taiwanensis TaxID=986746 RepID=A0ABW1YTS6_9GAMM|nr:alpha/beta hydrolase [Microbulbifer taiwanensis]